VQADTLRLHVLDPMFLTPYELPSNV